MNGIELSEAYFHTYGLPMLRRDFPELLDRVAAGVCGQGSENFGFDDAVSRDHDFDPGFFLWLDKADYETYEFRLSRAYDALPDEFMGVRRIGKSVYENSRHGVRETGAFFAGLTGFPGVPETPAMWLAAPPHGLACAVNGRVFYDGAGTVTALRQGLSSPPRDVTLKRLSRALVFAAQAGQYNYSRALAHGERGAAALALAEFARNVCDAVCLLNGCWCPFYKWAFAASRGLPVCGDAVVRTQALLETPFAPETAAGIEAVAAILIAELKRRGLSDHPSDFLEPHAYEVAKKIEDPAIRALHIMA